jgi:hypothetical protein
MNWSGRFQLRTGAIKPGDKLPGESEIVRAYAVSAASSVRARRALVPPDWSRRNTASERSRWM